MSKVYQIFLFLLTAVCFLLAPLSPALSGSLLVAYTTDVRGKVTPCLH